MMRPADTAQDRAERAALYAISDEIQAHRTEVDRSHTRRAYRAVRWLRGGEAGWVVVQVVSSVALVILLVLVATGHL